MWPGLIIETRLSAEASARRIESITRPKRSVRQALDEDFPWPKRVPHGPPFVGRVNQLSFKLRRAIRYGNGFLPVIKGHIVPSEHGSVIHIGMRPTILAIGFMIVWLLVASASIAVFLWQAVSSSGWAGLIAPSLSFAGLLGVVSLVVSISFVPEQRKAAAILRHAFEGTTPPDKRMTPARSGSKSARLIRRR
jgi:hypothetical protein